MPIKNGNHWYDKDGVRVPTPNSNEEKRKQQEEIKKKQIKLPLDSISNKPKPGGKSNPS